MSTDKQLAAALVADHEDLYLVNVWFHHSIEELARFLPILVAGLAAQASDKNEEMQANLQSVMQRSNIPEVHLLDDEGELLKVLELDPGSPEHETRAR